MQLFLVVILVMAVNASWQFGTDGQFIYNQDCDFTDPAFQTFNIQQSARENCGKICSDNPVCKYFGAVDKECILMGGPGKAYKSGNTCGLVINRF